MRRALLSLVALGGLVSSARGRGRTELAMRQLLFHGAPGAKGAARRRAGGGRWPIPLVLRVGVPQARKTSLVRTLVIELAPTRVSAIHPGIVGDSPQWRDMAPERRQALVDRTPIGRLVTMAEAVNACRFLLENEAINGINLAVDGGWTCT